MLDHAGGGPFHVHAGVAEFLEGLGVGVVAVECGIENDLGVHASTMCVNECVYRGGIGEFIHSDAYRAGRAADETDDRGVTCVGLLNQLIVRISRVCARHRGSSQGRAATARHGQRDGCHSDHCERFPRGDSYEPLSPILLGPTGDYEHYGAPLVSSRPARMHAALSKTRNLERARLSHRQNEFGTAHFCIRLTELRPLVMTSIGQEVAGSWC